MDYSPYEIAFTAEGRRRVHAFSCLLAYSRRQYLRFVESQNFATTIREHVRAFEYFGGLTATCLYDNMKVVVTSDSAAQRHPVVVFQHSAVERVDDPLAQLQFIDELFWADDLTLGHFSRGPALAHSRVFATIPELVVPGSWYGHQEVRTEPPSRFLLRAFLHAGAQDWRVTR
jgi:hypothetical protein